MRWWRRLCDRHPWLLDFDPGWNTLLDTRDLPPVHEVDPTYNRYAAAGCTLVMIAFFLGMVTFAVVIALFVSPG